MKDPTRRYDAWRNPIVQHADMVRYYQGDKKAIAVLKDCMPHMFVVIPSVEIRIYTGITPIVEMTSIFPGGEKKKTLDLKPRSWEALRRTWKNGKGWEHGYLGNGVIFLRKKGTVLREPANKFGICR